MSMSAATRNIVKISESFRSSHGYFIPAVEMTKQEMLFGDK
jgi:hypothetical protein